jgi:acyl carrier protein
MIYKIIAKALEMDQDDIKSTHDLVKDLGADSLNLVEIIMAVEEDYDIEIPDDDFDQLTTVGSIIRYIDQSQERSSREYWPTDVGRENFIE